MVMLPFWPFKEKTDSTFLVGSPGCCSMLSEAPMPTKEDLIDQIEVGGRGKSGAQMQLRLKTSGEDTQGYRRGFFL